MRQGGQSQKSPWGSLRGRGVTLAIREDPPGFRVGDGVEAAAADRKSPTEGGKGQTEPVALNVVTTAAIIIIY